MTQIRRRFTGAHTLQVETLADGAKGWTPSSHLVALGYEAPYTPGWEVRHAISYGGRPRVPVLPFQPLSVRHFYGSDAAIIDAFYGHLKRLLPPVGSAVESLVSTTREILPGLSATGTQELRPTYRLQNPLTLIPTESPISVPEGAQSLDYEPRLGFVIAKELFNATPEEAEAAISAFVVVSEFGVPENSNGGAAWSLPATPFGSMSEYAVSARSLTDGWRDLEGSVSINGERVFHSRIGHDVGLGEMLSAASAAERLLPGELFSIDALDGAGSVAGGSGQPLSRGDHLVIDVPGLGRIEHAIS